MFLCFIALGAISQNTIPNKGFVRIDNVFDESFVFDDESAGIFTVRNSDNVDLFSPPDLKTTITENTQGSTFMVFNVDGFSIDGTGEYNITFDRVNLRLVDYAENIKLNGIQFIGNNKTISAISVKTDPTPDNLSQGEDFYKSWVLDKFEATNLTFTNHGNEAIYIGTTQSPHHYTGYAKIDNVFVSGSGREFIQAGHVNRLEIGGITCHRSGIKNPGVHQMNGIQVAESRGYLKDSILDQVPEYGVLLSTSGFSINNVYISNTGKAAVIVLSDARIQSMQNKNGSYDPIRIKNLYVKNISSSYPILETASDKIPIIINNLYIDGSNEVYRGVNGASGNVVVNNVIRGSLPSVVLSNKEPEDSFFSSMGFRYKKQDAPVAENCKKELNLINDKGVWRVQNQE